MTADSSDEGGEGGAALWCDVCQRPVDDAELVDEGACPTCGTVLNEPHRVPWHFRVLVVATAIYLLYRLVQGLIWLAHHI